MKLCIKQPHQLIYETHLYLNRLTNPIPRHHFSKVLQKKPLGKIKLSNQDMEMENSCCFLYASSMHAQICLFDLLWLIYMLLRSASSLISSNTGSRANGKWCENDWHMPTSFIFGKPITRWTILKHNIKLHVIPWCHVSKTATQTFFQIIYFTVVEASCSVNIATT